MWDAHRQVARHASQSHLVYDPDPPANQVKSTCCPDYMHDGSTKTGPANTNIRYMQSCDCLAIVRAQGNGMKLRTEIAMTCCVPARPAQLLYPAGGQAHPLARTWAGTLGLVVRSSSRTCCIWCGYQLHQPHASCWHIKISNQPVLPV